MEAADRSTPGDADAWLATVRSDTAIGERSREGWLRQQAREETTLTGVLLDLAEQGTPVRISVAGGEEHSGTISAVGTDVLVLRRDGGATVVVPAPALVTVRSPAVGRSRDLAGDRVPVVRTTLHELLHRWLPERPEVVLHLGPARVRGELRAVGRDVVLVREHASQPDTIVSLAHVTTLTTLDRLPTP